MGFLEITIVVVALLMLYFAYKVGEKRRIGGLGGVVLVVVFNLFGFLILWYLPKA